MIKVMHIKTTLLSFFIYQTATNLKVGKQSVEDTVEKQVEAYNSLIW